MSWAYEDIVELRTRAEQAVGDTDLDALFNRWRRIVGPRPKEMSALARQAFEAIRCGVDPTAEQRQALERAIRLLRPARPVQAGMLTPLDADTAAAFPDWAEFSEAIRRYLPAIGRIDIPPQRADESTTPFATGFLVADNQLVTNDHVVALLTLDTGRLIPGQAEVRFGQEVGRSDDGGPVPLERVIARDPDLDLALVGVAAGSSSRGTIPIDQFDIGVGDPIAAVGYPIPGAVEPEVASALLGDAYGMKRVSPGVVMRLHRNVLSHDCTTLGGSSGSPLFSLPNARLVGVHYDGWYLTRNHAVWGVAMHEFLKEHLR